MSPDDITPAWLSRILQTDVTDVTCEPIGDGLVGMNLRVGIATAERSDAPASVVVKLASLDPTSRATGIALRNYEREVKFYAEIADTVDIRVPGCLHGEWMQDTGDFVLVLEDMAPAEQGNQVLGCDADRAHAAVRELARLHAPRWDDPTLDEHEFLTRRTGPADVDQLVGLWTMFMPGFLATYEHHLDGRAQAVLASFGQRIGEWMDGRTGPKTVTHGDFRLDNLMFGTTDGGPPVTAVDWQTPGHGSPIGDLAYFCGAGLVPEDRRLTEQSLVRSYANVLLTYGITVDEPWVWEQYRREAFGGVVMSVVASQIVGASDRSEAMFAAMATRHLQHCVDLDALEVI
jgi:aminoglycoside/choline kinase family phosphotransferase